MKEFDNGKRLHYMENAVIIPTQVDPENRTFSGCVYDQSGHLGILPKGLRPFPPGRHEQEKYLSATPRENQTLYYVPPSEADVIAFDPSEAVSGPVLKRLIPQMFEIVERKGFGGTLLSYMTGHFDFKRTNTDEYARSWLRILIQIEDTLIQNKILDDEFVFYVLRNRNM